MNCTNAQDLIITDYYDGRASELTQDQIKTHVLTCADCRAFEQAFRKNADMLFKNLGPEQPPAEVWERIHATIMQKRLLQEPSFIERLLVFLRESFIVRRPAYAIATAFTVILATVVFLGSPLRQQMLVKDYLSQKSAFMIAMNSASNGELDKVADFNTAIEQYLF